MSKVIALIVAWSVKDWNGVKVSRLQGQCVVCIVNAGKWAATLGLAPQCMSSK